MKNSGYRKLLYKLSKLSKFNALNHLLGYKTNTDWFYSCLQIRPRENWFQYVRRVYATAINFPCNLTFILCNVCVLVLFQWLFLDQIIFETKQKSKYKVDFHFIFISIKKIFWIYPKIFGENPWTNQNLANLTL